MDFYTRSSFFDELLYTNVLKRTFKKKDVTIFKSMEPPTPGKDPEFGGSMTKEQKKNKIIQINSQFQNHDIFIQNYLQCLKCFFCEILYETQWDIKISAQYRY